MSTSERQQGINPLNPKPKPLNPKQVLIHIDGVGVLVKEMLSCSGFRRWLGVGVRLWSPIVK